MSGLLESENYSLRRQLETLLEEAQRNEDKMRRFDQLERRLIGAGSIVELIALLLTEYRVAFAIEHVTLCLVDTHGEVQGILDESEEREWSGAGLTLAPSAAELDALYRGDRRPQLGAFDPQRHAGLFDAPDGAIGSVALLPLVRHNDLIGSLHFGSASIERYAGDYGTDFLERLAAVVAVCIDSALSHERLKQVGLTDGLTGVHNRRYFDHRCAIEVSQARRHARALSCMFIDVDRFKRINDTYGHQVGDEILRAVAGNVLAQLRLGDTVARYGGEEFVVLLPHTDLCNAELIAGRIRACIERALFFPCGGQGVKATISIGVSELAPSASDEDDAALVSQMLAAADAALYRAKRDGRNRVCCAEARARPAPCEARPAWWARMFRVRPG